MQETNPDEVHHTDVTVKSAPIRPGGRYSCIGAAESLHVPSNAFVCRYEEDIELANGGEMSDRDAHHR